jgi:hypothetical protein
MNEQQYDIKPERRKANQCESQRLILLYSGTDDRCSFLRLSFLGKLEAETNNTMTVLKLKLKLLYIRNGCKRYVRCFLLFFDGVYAIST